MKLFCPTDYLTSVSVDGLNRKKAFFLYHGKMYESEDNHQDCLRQILEAQGNSYKNAYGLMMENEEDIDLATQITWGMSQTQGNDVIGFDLFADGGKQYFICHFKEDAVPYWDEIKNFAQSRGYLFGHYHGPREFLVQD